MNKKICAGIVLYNPDIDRLYENIKAIIDQVSVVYLQDNGSENIQQVDIICDDFSNVKLIRSSKNRGIAWALNQLCMVSYENGYDWIVTLDQDSVCPDNMLSEYTKYLNSAEMICPKIVDRNCGAIFGSDRKIENVKKCITSGSMLNLEAWKKNNGFDEVMFIDGVDFEFCDRFVKLGMRIVKVNDVKLCHEIGNIEVRRFLGIKVIVKNHSAFRKYYIARNILYLARKKKKKILILKGILQEFKLLMIVVLYEREKKEKIKSILKGATDGFTCKIKFD